MPAVAPCSSWNCKNLAAEQPLPWQAVYSIYGSLEHVVRKKSHLLGRSLPSKLYRRRDSSLGPLASVVASLPVCTDSNFSCITDAMIFQREGLPPPPHSFNILEGDRFLDSSSCHETNLSFLQQEVVVTVHDEAELPAHYPAITAVHDKAIGRHP
jgi:hypothetical protein